MQIKSNFVTVIFSKDRPLQLDLTLTTNKEKCLEKEYRNEIVIYKASNDRFENCYKQVAKEHPDVKFLKETNFKLNIYKCVKGKEYVLFVVDDNIFTGKYSIKNICNMLATCEGALGFSLRLGTNTKKCYPLKMDNVIPEFQKLWEGIYAFNWKGAGAGDFSYPLEVSSSLYRLKDISPLLEGLNYNNPNDLEWLMSNYLNQLSIRPFLLCYNTSVSFCNPVNKVQTVNNNRVGKNPAYSIENLLKLYEEGFRINSNDFDGFVSNGAHQEVAFNFYGYK